MKNVNIKINTGKKLAHLQNITHSFPAGKKHYHTILSNINLSLYENEIVSILGRSGAGKSTLLRIIAGLIEPSTGHITNKGYAVKGPNENMSMVFQNFALLPWLTVEKNISFGLEAQGMPRMQSAYKTDEAIDMIGLNDYKNAYPKELSGGMCQRVGVARALVVEPEVLLMDEPFSSLDVFTANKLRSEVLDLWENMIIKTRTIVFVTHNVDEAVAMSDRVIVLDNNPGRIKKEFHIHENRPRNLREAQMHKYIDDITESLMEND